MQAVAAGYSLTVQAVPTPRQRWVGGGGACVFTCKGCTEVTRLVGEVGDLRQMMESMKRMITRQGLEEERGITGIQEAFFLTGRNGGEGEVLTCDDTRQQLDRRKPEWKGDSRTKFVRR